VLRRIVEAAARLPSFADAALAMHLAGIDISVRQLERIALEVGTELAQQRDRKAVLRRRRQLPPRVAATPAAVVVEVDGGHLRCRQPGRGPGVYHEQCKEDKVACLVTLQSRVSARDPQPEPPPALLGPRRVQRLVRQIKGWTEDDPQAEAHKGDAAVSAPAPATRPRPGAPRHLVRTCLASMADRRAFGPLVAAEAQERDFYRAQRRAFVADGARYNWAIQRGYFPDFVPIADLLHVLCYLYQAAWAVGADEAGRWSLYAGWLRAVWQGRVRAVIEELQAWQERIGKPAEGEEAEERDPRRWVAESLGYLRNNALRMDYPRYRREGLPVTSSLAESLVGEVNARVKASGKFWGHPGGAEAILQLRAAVLSEDDRLARHFAQRPGNIYRRRRGEQGAR
jgi:hypothetical protein